MIGDAKSAVRIINTTPSQLSVTTKDYAEIQSYKFNNDLSRRKN